VIVAQGGSRATRFQHREGAGRHHCIRRHGGDGRNGAAGETGGEGTGVARLV
jgi:hypothetical protein